MFVFARESGNICYMNIIGLCFCNAHAYLHISNYTVCVLRANKGLELLCVYKVSFCVFAVLSSVCFISLYCKINVAHCGVTCSAFVCEFFMCACLVGNSDPWE